MEISSIYLEQKSGGKSGDWQRSTRMIKVFFADLPERLGCADMLVENFSGENIIQLKDFIVKQNPHWEKIF